MCARSPFFLTTCLGPGMFLNASKCEGLWIGKQRDCQVPWQVAVYGDASADEKTARLILDSPAWLNTSAWRSGCDQTASLRPSNRLLGSWIQLPS